MKSLRELLSLSNIAYTLAAAAVVVAEIVDILVPQLNWLSISDKFLLLVLGLLVTGTLVERIRSQPRPCFDIMDAWPPFDQYARDACEILVAGGSLDMLIHRYGNFLVEKAKAGCEVRLILMDPESPAIPKVELWSSPDLPKGFYRDAICRSLRLLAAIDDDRKLKVRLDPSIPALAVIILNGSRPDGRIRVDIQPFQAVAVERPVFELTRQGEDLKWYNMFYRRYSEKLWSMATPVDLSNLP